MFQLSEVNCYAYHTIHTLLFHIFYALSMEPLSEKRIVLSKVCL